MRQREIRECSARPRRRAAGPNRAFVRPSGFRASVRGATQFAASRASSSAGGSEVSSDARPHSGTLPGPPVRRWGASRARRWRPAARLPSELARAVSAACRMPRRSPRLEPRLISASAMRGMAQMRHVRDRARQKQRRRSSEHAEDRRPFVTRRTNNLQMPLEGTSGPRPVVADGRSLRSPPPLRHFQALAGALARRVERVRDDLPLQPRLPAAARTATATATRSARRNAAADPTHE